LPTARAKITSGENMKTSHKIVSAALAGLLAGAVYAGEASGEKAEKGAKSAKAGKEKKEGSAKGGEKSCSGAKHGEKSCAGSKPK